MEGNLCERERLWKILIPASRNARISHFARRVKGFTVSHQKARKTAYFHLINQFIAFSVKYVYFATPIKNITNMNKKQRKQLQDLCDKAEELKQDVEMIRDDEQDKIDNLPDSLQGSSKEDEYQEGIDALDEIINSLDDVIDKFQEVI